MRPLPLNASLIKLEWPFEQGGFGVTARTDRAGLPIIGLYSLDPTGKPTGLAIQLAHEHLFQRLVVGEDRWPHVITVTADALINYRGLALRVIMPQWMIDRGYDRYLFTPWKSAYSDGQENANIVDRKF